MKIVSEYDQETPQSQTADNPMAPRGRAAQPSRDIRKTQPSKATRKPCRKKSPWEKSKCYLKHTQICQADCKSEPNLDFRPLNRCLKNPHEDLFSNNASKENPRGEK